MFGDSRLYLWLGYIIMYIFVFISVGFTVLYLIGLFTGSVPFINMEMDRWTMGFLLIMTAFSGLYSYSKAQWFGEELMEPMHGYVVKISK